MDFNDIIRADREGKLSDYSIADLREMQKICAVHLQNKNTFMVHPCESVERELLRKEEQHRHEQLISSQNAKANQKTDEPWYKKPVGIIVIGVAVAVLAAIAKYLLGI